MSNIKKCDVHNIFTTMLFTNEQKSNFSSRFCSEKERQERDEKVVVFLTFGFLFINFSHVTRLLKDERKLSFKFLTMVSNGWVWNGHNWVRYKKLIYSLKPI